MTMYYKNVYRAEKLRKRGLPGKQAKYIAESKVKYFLAIYKILAEKIGHNQLCKQYELSHEIKTNLECNKISTTQAAKLLKAYEDLKRNCNL